MVKRSSTLGTMGIKSPYPQQENDALVEQGRMCASVYQPRGM